MNKTVYINANKTTPVERAQAKLERRQTDKEIAAEKEQRGAASSAENEQWIKKYNYAYLNAAWNAYTANSQPGQQYQPTEEDMQDAIEGWRDYNHPKKGETETHKDSENVKKTDSEIKRTVDGIRERLSERQDKQK